MVENNRSLVMCDAKTINYKEKIDEFWKSVASTLNAEGGATRNPEGWKVVNIINIFF